MLRPKAAFRLFSHLLAARYRDLRCFALLSLLYLAPVWIFPYLPTQDGPSHLYNAIILKDYGRPYTRYQEFFELRLEQFPNWISHALLFVLLHVFPPLIAEKLLASLYVLGFAWSFRYFLTSFGKDYGQLAGLGLLFVFNRCFLMGFYSYCLSLVVYWIILGYCLRRHQESTIAGTAALMLLFMIAYFSHLVGFLLAAASAAWIALASPTRRMRQLCVVLLGVGPALWLTSDYLIQTRFFPSPEAAALVDRAASWIKGTASLAEVRLALSSINRELFEPYEGPHSLVSLAVMLLYEGLILLTLLAPRRASTTAAGPVTRWPVFVLAAGIAVLSLTLPNSLGRHGEFLRSRLVLLPLLLVVPCFYVPSRLLGQRTLRVMIVAVLGLNLILVMRHFQSANQELREFTAAAAQIGPNRTLVMYRPGAVQMIVDHLAHAGAYYCMDSHNIDLRNYEAQTVPWPVRFRADCNQTWEWYPSTYHEDKAVDAILVWDAESGVPAALYESYRNVYSRGRLQALVHK